MFVLGSPVDADAPPASARDTPAIRRPRKSGSMRTTPTTRLRGSGYRHTTTTTTLGGYRVGVTVDQLKGAPK